MDDIVSDIMRLLSSRYGLDCSRYAPPTAPRIECKLPPWNGERKLIVIIVIVGERESRGG